MQPRDGAGTPRDRQVSHVRQVAARLNWPCVRVNLDGHARDGPDWQGRHRHQRRQADHRFQPGILTWRQRLCARVLTSDAGRADVMLVIQRAQSRRTADAARSERVIEPHPRFACLPQPIPSDSDATGLPTAIPAAQRGQMDCWNIVVTLNYPEHDREIDVVLRSELQPGRAARASAMIAPANLTRRGGRRRPSTVMSPRTVVTGPRTQPVSGSGAGVQAHLPQPV